MDKVQVIDLTAARLDEISLDIYAPSKNVVEPRLSINQRSIDLRVGGHNKVDQLLPLRAGVNLTCNPAMGDTLNSNHKPQHVFRQIRSIAFLSAWQPAADLIVYAAYDRPSQSKNRFQLPSCARQRSVRFYRQEITHS